ncbi:MAG: ribosomal protein L7/L12 [Gemmataceae bacterium]
MEFWLAHFLIMVVLGFYIVIRRTATLTRDVARVDRKLTLLLKEMNISLEDAVPGISERVKEIARDPSRKIEAIKAYREETGAGLKESKDAVEAWIDSIRG